MTQSCCRIVFAGLLWLAGFGGDASSQSVVASSGEQQGSAREKPEVGDHQEMKPGGNVRVADPDGTTELHWAVHRGDPATVERLLRAGADPNAKSEYGVTPLFLACSAGSEGNGSIVEALLNAGADTTTLVNGEPPIVTASRTGNIAAVKSLMARGVDVNAKEATSGQTALMQAVAEAHSEVARSLIDNGAAVDARTALGFNALAFAVRAGDLESVRLLVRAGASVNDVLTARAVRTDVAGREGANRTTLLVMAVVNAHYEVAKFLLDEGADPNADSDGRTALHALVQSMNWEGLGPPDSELTGQGDLGARAFMTELLDAGADPNARMTKERGSHSYNLDSFIGGTPFWFAAKAGDVPTMRYLLKRGASPLLANSQGTTPLMVAAGVGFVDGVTAGTEKEALEAVQLTLELGNPLDTVQGTGSDCVPRNYDSHAAGRVCGWTALHGAAARGADSIVRLLVDKGARMDIRDKTGKTAQEVAEFSSLAASPYVRESTSLLLKQLATDRHAPH